MNTLPNFANVPAPITLLGVGLGPSNLALAIALEECGVIEDCVFAEKQMNFGWHEAMKLPDVDMQISFMKDLVTPRNPMSPHSFLNYLRKKGRLEQFINLRTFYPTRFEYGDYMGWVADAFSANTLYGFDVQCVEAVDVNGNKLFRAIGQNRDGKEVQLTTQNICFATGHHMSIPDFARPHYGTRVFHTSEFLHRIKALQSKVSGSGKSARILVVGAGQSAAETALYCNDHFPDAQVDWCFRQHSLKPMDDSHFVNEIFMGKMVDRWYDMSAADRESFRKEFHYANYSAIDGSLIQKIYTTAYNRSIENRHFVNIRNLSELVAVEAADDCVTATIRDLQTGENKADQYDFVVLGTGYGHQNFSHILEPIEDYLCRSDTGELIVDRNYRVQTKSDLSGGLFTLGSNERTHGIGDTLLSNIAIRTEDLLQAILTNRPCTDQPAATATQSSRAIEYLGETA